jgi:hypothetical protein
VDEHAVKCYPLLAKYYPTFDASMLDVLELSTLAEYNRLTIVQSYLMQRCDGWSGQRSKTIFNAPANDSYAVQAYDDTLELQELRLKIEEGAKLLLAKKEAEWRNLSELHVSRMSAWHLLVHQVHR